MDADTELVVALGKPFPGYRNDCRPGPNPLPPTLAATRR